ncbi:MAG TPA: serine hydrolase [Gemmatimonadaceae bacterium]|nr:serine hydrolase [Gemmatimonadaceae bacterium]
MVAHLALALVLAAATEKLPVRAPRAVGMSPERLATIDRVVRRGITAGGYPGASVVIGRRGAAVMQKGFGHLGWTASSPDVDPDRTIYDLASLSKVIGTTTAAMILYDEGRLDLDAPVSRYLPEFSGGTKDLVTVRHLLTHRSGLPAGRELWRMTSSPSVAKQIVINTPLYCQPGACYEYSDLGADVLGWVVESVAGLRLDTFLTERVFKPLGMNDTFYNPPDSVRYRIAPTEVTPPRGYPLKGEVHDENAFALGGVAGHAGLFSTAADIAVFAQMMLNGGVYDDVRIFSDSTVALFTRRTAGTRALGWDTADGQGGSGDYLTSSAYGHTGFTGTSIWIDPDRQMFVVFLTNRVHAARARRPAKVISDVRADLADAAALSVEDTDQVLNMPASFRADRADGWNRAVRRSRSSRRGAKARSSRTATKSAKSAKARGTKSASSKARSARPATKGRVSAKSAAKPTKAKARPTASARSLRSGAKVKSASVQRGRTPAKRPSGSAGGR